MADIDKIFAIAVLKYFQKLLAEGQAARTRVAIDYITTVFRKKMRLDMPLLYSIHTGRMELLQSINRVSRQRP
jgi:hypothetical protein